MPNIADGNGGSRLAFDGLRPLSRSGVAEGHWRAVVGVHLRSRSRVC